MHDILPWHDLYTNMLPLHQISVGEKISRSLAVYLFLIFGLRIAGKRELAQLNPLDLIVLLTLSNTVQNAIIGNDNSVTGGLIGAATLLTVNYALVRIAYVNPAADRLINGNSVPLIQQGKLQRRNLKRELITEPELRAALRRQGVRKLDDVESAMLETSGTISVFPRHPTPEEAYFTRLHERLDRIEAALTART